MRKSTRNRCAFFVIAALIALAIPQTAFADIEEASTHNLILTTTDANDEWDIGNATIQSPEEVESWKWEPDIVVTLSGKKLKEGTDYQLYPEYIGDGPGYTVRTSVVGTGIYHGEKQFTYRIVYDLKKEYSDSVLLIYSRAIEKIDENGEQCWNYSIASQSYTGKAIRPKVNVAFCDFTGSYGCSGEDYYGEAYEEWKIQELKEGVDYTVQIKNNVAPGKATVTITGIGCYKGSVSKTFAIKCPINIASVSSIKAQVYKGAKLKPKPVVTCLGKSLQLGVDYTLSYENNNKGGKATVIVKGKGYYTGSKSKQFNIKANLKYASVAKIVPQALYYKTVKPKPVVKFHGSKLVKGRDYTLSYKKNQKSGKATVIIKGKGYYTGKKKVSFTILPKGKGETITKDEYIRIKVGMTYKMVKYLIGGRGKLTSDYWGSEYIADDLVDVCYENYEWKGANGGGGASVSFKDGRVISKGQVGLR